MTNYCIGEQVMFSSAIISNLLNGGLLPFVPTVIIAWITAWITSKLTSSREHQRWTLDNKKLEWRELIDEMHECFNHMANFRNPTDAILIPNSEVDASIRKGFRILRSRVFIADAIAQNKIMEEWEKLRTYRDPDLPHAPGHALTPVGFNQRAADLEDMLMEAVRHDLKLAARRPRSPFSYFRAKR